MDESSSGSEALRHDHHDCTPVGHGQVTSAAPAGQAVSSLCNHLNASFDLDDQAVSA